MSKIYDALQQANREQDEYEKRQGISSSVRKAAKLNMEQEMLALYQVIDSRLPNRQKKLLQFIASSKGEGTSTITREFALAVVRRLGKTALLIDADQNFPGRYPGFDAMPESSLEEVIKEESSLEKALCRTGHSDLFLGLVSYRAASMLEIFDPPAMEKMLEILKKRFELILIDSPPAGAASDGPALARIVDGVVLVVEANRTRWPVVETIRDKIVQHGGNILGIAFNKRRYYIPQAIYKRL